MHFQHNLLDLGGGTSGTRFRINSLLLLVIALLGFELQLEHASDFEAFSSTTSDFLARHSFVLWVGLLWNSHHILVSFFIFMVLFFSCGFDWFFWVTAPWISPLFYGLEVPFPCFIFLDPKSHFLCLTFFSILTAYWYAALSEEISRKSIYAWMYLCK